MFTDWETELTHRQINKWVSFSKRSVTVLQHSYWSVFKCLHLFWGEEGFRYHQLMHWQREGAMVCLGSLPHFMLSVWGTGCGCYLVLVIKRVWSLCTTHRWQQHVRTYRLAPGTRRTLSVKEIVYGKSASGNSWYTINQIVLLFSPKNSTQTDLPGKLKWNKVHGFWKWNSGVWQGGQALVMATAERKGRAARSEILLSGW